MTTCIIKNQYIIFQGIPIMEKIIIIVLIIILFLL